MDNNVEHVRTDDTRPVVVDSRGRGAGHGTTLVAWLALLLALLALSLAWMAYNRTGEDLERRIQEGITNATQSVERGAEQTTDAVDSGVNGVDEDDTDTGTGTTGTDTTTTPAQ